MKHFLILGLVVLILVSSAAVCSADVLSDAMGGLSGMLGLAADDSGSDLPSLDDIFDGSMVSVKVGGKTVKIHENFKKAMDKYEAFFDEYVAFMKNPDMLQYASFMAKYVDAMAALEGINEEKMSDNEALYYAEVMLRIEQKLLTVSAQ